MLQYLFLIIYKSLLKQGPQKLSSLKTLKIQNPRYKNTGMSYQKCLSNSKIVHIDPKTTEIWPKQLNGTLSVIKIVSE